MFQLHERLANLIGANFHRIGTSQETWIWSLQGSRSLNHSFCATSGKIIKFWLNAVLKSKLATL